MNKVQPKTNYKEKYEHLIGKEAALDAARYVCALLKPILHVITGILYQNDSDKG
jgi:hypothetical protein